MREIERFGEEVALELTHPDTRGRPLSLPPLLSSERPLLSPLSSQRPLTGEVSITLAIQDIFCYQEEKEEDNEENLGEGGGGGGEVGGGERG